MKHNAKRIFLITLAVVFLVCAVAPAFAETTTTYATTTAKVEFFSKPVTDMDYYVANCHEIPSGATVTVLGMVGRFAYIKYNSYVGYVEAKYLVEASAAPAAGTTSGTTASSSTQYGLTKEKVYFRIQPKSDSSSSNRVSGCASIAKGETVTINSITSDGDWYNISYNGYTGYARARDINTNVTTSTSGTTSGTTGGTGTATPTGSGEARIPAGLTLTDAQAKLWKASIANYSSYKAKYPATIGWIYVPGTNINYPIMFDANWKYADHDPDGSSSKCGSIFGFSSGLMNITTISGHNMRGTAKKTSTTTGWMFHGLHHVRCALQGKSTCDYCGRSCKGQGATIFNITMGNYTSWQLFSMYETKGVEAQNYNCFNQNLSGASLQSWIDRQIKSSTKNFGVTVTSSDKIMVLQTCGKSTGNNETHFYMFLKAIG